MRNISQTNRIDYTVEFWQIEEGHKYLIKEGDRSSLKVGSNGFAVIKRIYMWIVDKERQDRCEALAFFAKREDAEAYCQQTYEEHKASLEEDAQRRNARNPSVTMNKVGPEFIRHVW